MYVPILIWHKGVGLSTSSIDTSFLEIVSAWDLTQVVNEPSRGKNFLDIILTSNPAAFKSCRLCPPYRPLIIALLSVNLCCRLELKLYS